TGEGAAGCSRALRTPRRKSAALVRKETPRLCRGGSRSLTAPGVGFLRDAEGWEKTPHPHDKQNVGPPPPCGPPSPQGRGKSSKRVGHTGRTPALSEGRGWPRDEVGGPTFCWLWG